MKIEVFRQSSEIGVCIERNIRESLFMKLIRWDDTFTNDCQHYLNSIKQAM